jgi:hypothetical protein
MYEPGLDRHEWEGEMAALEDDLRTEPAEALGDLDELIVRMLDEAGYDVMDPVVREGDEREVVAEFLAAHEIREEYERGSEELSPGDIAAAINGYRAIFEFLVSNRVLADADITLSGEPET